MIIKEFKDRNHDSAMRKAGHAAEKQMAFYLKREFQASESIFVLNDVKVSADDDNAQIDHLIVYPAGVILIESKSVSGELTINAYGDWIRKTGRKKEGMPSPIIQAVNQSNVLKRYLAQQALMLDWEFPKPFHYDVFVAVSDNGIINREFEGTLDELLKADQLSGKAKDLILRRLKSSMINQVQFDFAKEVSFNLINAKKETVIKSKVKENKASYKIKPNDDLGMKCSKCGSTKIQVTYGRSYYFKCSNCGGNTPLKKWLVCESPECKPRIRKSKNDFFKECSRCESSTLFFQNEK